VSENEEAPTQPSIPALVDTDVLCRYLLNDYPDSLSARAAQLIESEQPLRVSILTLAEAAHVLRSVYGRSGDQIAGALILLLERQNVESFEVITDLAIAALELTRPSGRVSFPDALLWAVARSADLRVRSFDRRFPRDGIDLREP
jgi:predicted nucleic acid-binding protein